MIPLAAIGLGAQLLAPAFQFLAGDSQAEQAKKLQYVDETPEAEKEALALARQRAADARLPGEGLAVDRISQNQSSTSAAARGAGGSSVSVLAALNAGQRASDNALADLAVKSAANQQQQQHGLQEQLGRVATYQQRSRDKYNAAKSALTESAARNKFGALGGLAATAAYAATKYGGGGTPTVAPAAAAPVPPANGYPGTVPYLMPEDDSYQRLFGKMF